MTQDRDDDILTGPVPAPDEEATPAERTHARTFADLVDKTITGRTPAAMSADDRALLEVATVIRAASGGIELSAGTRRALVEEALRQAVGEATRSGSGSVSSITRGRGRRVLPWAISAASLAVAAAAILVLWLRAPAPPTPATTATTAALPAHWISRPADPLIGRIERDQAGDASGRIDIIFADRLDGYRERRLARGAKP